MTPHISRGGPFSHHTTTPTSFLQHSIDSSHNGHVFSDTSRHPRLIHRRPQPIRTQHPSSEARCDRWTAVAYLPAASDAVGLIIASSIIDFSRLSNTCFFRCWRGQSQTKSTWRRLDGPILCLGLIESTGLVDRASAVRDVVLVRGVYDGQSCTIGQHEVPSRGGDGIDLVPPWH